MKLTITALLVAGALSALAAASGAAVITVNVRNYSFTPATVNIMVGDTIHWTDTQGSHTITNGTGSSDPNAGSLFDQTTNNGQSFNYTFNAPGVFPYFCRFHESLNMNGTVNVQAVTPVEPSTWGHIKSLWN
jgi:plastocyanin